VAVAWADGSVQAREREVILDAAKKSGIQPQDGRYPILERWLAEPPRKEMIDAWELYLRGLCQKLTPPEVENLKHDLLDLARSVARAAGGFLGLGEKISASERDVLDELEGAFSA
jgi:tellurite resistance protein